MLRDYRAGRLAFGAGTGEPLPMGHMLARNETTKNLERGEPAMFIERSYTSTNQWTEWDVRRDSSRGRENLDPIELELDMDKRTRFLVKIGRKLHGPELLPQSVWRYMLRRVAWWFVMGILGMLWLAFLVACAAVYA